MVQGCHGLSLNVINAREKEKSVKQLVVRLAVNVMGQENFMPLRSVLFVEAKARFQKKLSVLAARVLGRSIDIKLYCHGNR